MAQKVTLQPRTRAVRFHQAALTPQKFLQANYFKISKHFPFFILNTSYLQRSRNCTSTSRLSKYRIFPARRADIIPFDDNKQSAKQVLP